jgi:phosphatidylglycerol:prolipoprotein diacylglycerol transferase
MLLAAMLAAGLAGAKLYSAGERGGLVWWAPSWELTNGYRYPGGLIGLAVAVGFLRRRCCPGVPLLSLADELAGCVAAAMILVRFGCFFAGCCHGLPSGLPWSVTYPHYSPAWQAHVERGWLPAGSAASLAVHPLQLYFAAASLLTLAAVVLARRRGRAGGAFFVFLLVDGAAKYLLESLRLDHHIGLQLTGLTESIVGGLGVWRSGSPGAFRLARFRVSS